MASTGEKNRKFAVSVNERVVARIDEQASKLKLTRNDIVEEALKMWLRIKFEEEEKYFVESSTEMNADARAWNTLTTAVYATAEKVSF